MGLHPAFRTRIEEKELSPVLSASQNSLRVVITTHDYHSSSSNRPQERRHPQKQQRQPLPHIRSSFWLCFARPFALHPNVCTVGRRALHTAMPVAIPEELVEVRPRTVRMGWFATVHNSTLYQGPKDAPVFTYRKSEDALSIRLLFWAGTFTDADFAYHVCRLMRGDASNLPGALRGNGGNMTLEEAEALGVPVGFGCWNPVCRCVAPVALPKALRPSDPSSARRRASKFKACANCLCARYCSRSCQHADGHRHKNTCEAVGSTFRADRRKETHHEDTVYTAFGYGTEYEYCIWTHIWQRGAN